MRPCLFCRRIGHWHINAINFGQRNPSTREKSIRADEQKKRERRRKKKKNYAVFEYLSQGCTLGAIVAGFHGARQRACNHNLFRGGLQGVPVLSPNSALILWKIVKRRWGDYKFRLIRYSNIRAPFAILTRRIHDNNLMELQIEIKDGGGKPPSFPREKVIEIFF